MQLQSFLTLSAAVLLAFASRAHAGASLFIDDAAITPSRHCQVASWARFYNHNQELTAVPACHLKGFELGLGLSHHTHGDANHIADFGVKHVFRSIETHTVAAGISANLRWHSRLNHRDGWAIKVPVTIALDPQRRTLLHVNLGWDQPKKTPGILTGGLGFEHQLSDRWALLGEYYADREGVRIPQFGLRRLVNDHFNADLLLGDKRGPDNDTWITLGVNITFPTVKE